MLFENCTVDKDKIGTSPVPSIQGALALFGRKWRNW